MATVARKHGGRRGSRLTTSLLWALTAATLVPLAVIVLTALTPGNELTGGFALPSHLTGTNFLHVPYKGIPQAVADTVAREVHFSNAVLPVALPFVQSGRLRALGVTSARRASLLPDVPALGEVVPRYEMFGWYSLVAPTGTPPAVLAKVSAEVVLAVKEPQFGEQLKSLGIDLVGNTRAEFDSFRRNETKRMGEIVKASGVDLK